MKLLPVGLAALGVVVAASLAAAPLLVTQASSDTQPSQVEHTQAKADKKAAKKADKPEKAERGEKAAHDVPPGLAKQGVTQAPGPASEHGKGHGWGRAHAPGQLKDKDKQKDEKSDD